MSTTQNMIALNNPAYCAPWWLPGKHAQTVFPFLVRRPLSLPRKRERIELPDRDFIDLDWLHAPQPQGSAVNTPIIMLLHGLAGCSQSGYITHMQNVLQTHGYTSVAVNHRGCSGEPNRLPRAYHSGETQDAQYALDHIKQRYPQQPIFVIGYSMGGNILIKWLGEQGEHSQVAAGVAVSVPFELGNCAKVLDQGFAKNYRSRLIKCLREQISNKIQVFHQQGRTEYAQYLESLGDLYSIKSFIDFDHRFTAPLHGFNSGADYYKKCSSKQFLPYVKRPVLVIHAKNDPFMTTDVAPKPDEVSPDVTLEVFEHGGHVGFYYGKHPFSSQCWLLERIPAFLQECINNGSN